MVDPYQLSQSLCSSPSLSYLFDEDFLIRIHLEGGWVMKNKATKGITTIRPTDFGTIMFNVPIAEIFPDKDSMLVNMISQIDNMNGVLNLSPIEDGSLILLYTAFIPGDFTDLEVHGQLIRMEIRGIKDRIDHMRSLIEHEGPRGSRSDAPDTMFNADSFNRMIKDVIDKAEQERKKPKDNEGDEES